MTSAAAQHLTYGDGNQVAGNGTAINASNRFLAELKAWFSNVGKEK